MKRLLLISSIFLAVTGGFVTTADAQTQNTAQRVTKSLTKGDDSGASLASIDAQADAEARKYYKEGFKYGRANLFRQAVDLFNRAVLIKPNYKDAYFGLGQAYLGLRRWREAIQAFQKVILIDPEDLEAYSKWAEARAGLRAETKSPAEYKVPANEKLAKNFSPASPSKSLAAKPKPNGGNVKLDALIIPTSKKPVATPKPGDKTSNIPATQSSKDSVKSTGDKAVPSTTPELKATSSQVTGPKAIMNTPAPASDKSTGEKVTVNLASAPASNIASGDKDKMDVTSAPKSNNSSGDSVATINSPGATSNGSAAENSPVNVSPKQKANNVTAEKIVLNGLPPPASPTPKKSVTQPTANEIDLTGIYRVGIGDVLDVRLRDAPADQSSLFTVSPNGLLEHPILAQPLKVAGLTSEEITERVASDLKSRAVNVNPEVFVGVREYVSHTIIVSGLVREPGTKVLRREAIPLYVIIADAQPLPEAGRATIVPHETGQGRIVDLSDPKGMNLLVHPGDVISVDPRRDEFFYVGGEVKNPGEKSFRSGMRLTQAIIVAGGLTRKSKEAQLARESGDGLLVVKRYKLKDINAGKLADPFIEPGDRITVVR